MSFITKRERVFYGGDVCDLPPRNEGKIKAYASCTDTRAWSHFVSSKTEHLTELIKRNNELCTPVKYVPTKVIVDTLLSSKNLEIGKLKRKIEEFEQLLAAYDDLDLDCAQKCEIAKAHAAIKAANKDLDELCLNLDMSTYTDGFDTESFETGKSRSVQYSANWSIKSKGGDSDRSRGDAWTMMLERDTATQGNQTSLVCPCDVSVSVEDPRIDEMKEQIIVKDAKLNAMRNSLAIMENDICEPFGIYAHIYTALEKIFGVLSQNSKYKQYLNLMTAGKDIRCIDIKGKILFKMKVLEKFCLALIAPCSREFACANEKDCNCFYASISTKMEQSFQLIPADCKSSESIKRSQLVADIMEHEEMKEILSKESTLDENDDSASDTEKSLCDTSFKINEENQKRIKDLQESYDDLLNCYENLKHETDCIRVRCAKYDELELELEHLRSQLKEYNSLWNEKEHYRKRSEDLDSLKHQYIVLAEESSGLETKLRAESEINNIKANAIDELRAQNIALEKRVNDIYLSFEKDKNKLQCQLQESECKCMCQEQQIKTLNTQIIKLLEQQPEPENIPPDETPLHKENESLKEQLTRYQDIEYEFQDKVSRISELEIEIAKWRAAYEELFDRNKHYEDRIHSVSNEKENLLMENSALRDAIRDKTEAVENLMGIINTKSLEIHKLADENQNITTQLEMLGGKYEEQVNLSRQESQELFRKLKDYDDFVQKQEDLSNEIEVKMCEYDSVKKLLKLKLEENEKLQSELIKLQNEDANNKICLEMSKSKSSIMERKLLEFEDISNQFMSLKNAFEQLSAEKNALETELRKKAAQLESAIYSVKLNKKESSELLKQSETIQEELKRLHLDNDALQYQIDLLRNENKDLKIESARLSDLENELLNLKEAINELLNEKAKLEHSFKIKEQEITNMHNSLENKIVENQMLMKELDILKSHHSKAIDNIKTLENENELHQIELDRCKKQSSVLSEKLKFHDKLENELERLKTDHDAIKLEKDRLQKELEDQLLDLQKTKQENRELQRETGDLFAHNTELEKVLVNTRNELMQSSPSEKTPLTDLKAEIEKLRVEKNTGQQKIRDLLHKLDESEQIMANFEDDIHARDYKIATMQNQINNLEDEVRKLHLLLEQALEAGNDIKNTNQSIEQARKQIEAHHSKASHNMKLELAVLQKNKGKLEEELSTTKSEFEMSFYDKQNYLSEISELTNDREIIVTDIKQLEIESVGDSELNPDDCEIERILHSIDRIRKAFEARHAKTASLEQTLAKIQASSQLFLNKADEAKSNFENEKQRILNEKNDVLKEKNDLEKQLIDLKNDLNDKISRDAVTIRDLEAEIINQKLIIDKINDTTQNYIMTLEDEIQSLKDLYQDALSNICELQKRLSMSTINNDEKEIMIKNLIADLENKTKEISELKSSFNVLIKKVENKAVQTRITDNYKDESSQTYDFHRLSGSDTSSDQILAQDLTKTNKPEPKSSIKPMHDLLPQQNPSLVNEVQILAAEAEPTFDFVRSSYLNYKMKRLGQGILEHHSIESLTVTNSYIEEIRETSNNFAGSADSYNPQDVRTHSSNGDLVDIYHSLSNGAQTSSKIIDSSIQNGNRLGTYGQTNESVNLKTNNIIPVSEPVQPSEHYSDSKTKINAQNRIFFEKPVKINDNSVRKHEKSSVKFEGSTPLQLNETEETKLKLSINLPRVWLESSFITTTDNDNNSSDSYTVSTSSNHSKKQISDTTVNIPSSSEYDTKTGSRSLPTISDSDEMDKNLRSFIEIPSKDPSYIESNYPSDSTIYADKPHNNQDNFINFKDRKVKVTHPQELFTFLEQLQKPDYKVDDITMRFVTDDDNNSPTVITSKHSFIRYDNSEDLYLINKTAQNENIYTDVNDLRTGLGLHGNNKTHLPTDKISKRHGSKMQQQKHLRVGESEKSHKKDEIVTDRENVPKTDKVSSNSNVGFTNKKRFESELSHHDNLAELEADAIHKISKSSSNLYFIDDNDEKIVQGRHSDFALAYVLNSFEPDPIENPEHNIISTESHEKYDNEKIQLLLELPKNESTEKADKTRPKTVDQGSMANLDTNFKYYENIINGLRKSVEDSEKDHKMQIEAIKVQYDRHIRNIINEHNQGVRSIQSIHEETLHDYRRVHENEVENLRTMSIEAMRKVEKLEKECRSLKSKISLDAGSSLLDEVPSKCEGSLEVKIVKTKLQVDTKVLTKTALEAFDVKPKVRAHGPCTCSLDINISDTIRNIFEQVDVEQRKLAEITYLKYIAAKISNDHIETLDTQELSFLHLKVCRLWKQKLNKEEALQKKLDSLEVELIKKQKYTQQHIADIDRKVAQEKRRLEEVREAIGRCTPFNLSDMPLQVPETPDNNCRCPGNVDLQQAVAERRAAGDLMGTTTAVPRTRKKAENKGAITRTAAEERRDRRLYTDEPPTRLRRQNDRPQRLVKK